MQMSTALEARWPGPPSPGVVLESAHILDTTLDDDFSDGSPRVASPPAAAPAPAAMRSFAAPEAAYAAAAAAAALPQDSLSSVSHTSDEQLRCRDMYGAPLPISLGSALRASNARQAGGDTAASSSTPKHIGDSRALPAADAHPDVSAMAESREAASSSASEAAGRESPAPASPVTTVATAGAEASPVGIAAAAAAQAREANWLFLSSDTQGAGARRASFPQGKDPAAVRASFLRMLAGDSADVHAVTHTDQLLAPPFGGLSESSSTDPEFKLAPLRHVFHPTRRRGSLADLAPPLPQPPFHGEVGGSSGELHATLSTSKHLSSEFEPALLAVSRHASQVPSAMSAELAVSRHASRAPSATSAELAVSRHTSRAPSVMSVEHEGSIDLMPQVQHALSGLRGMLQVETDRRRSDVSATSDFVSLPGLGLGGSSRLDSGHLSSDAAPIGHRNRPSKHEFSTLASSASLAPMILAAQPDTPPSATTSDAWDALRSVVPYSPPHSSFQLWHSAAAATGALVRESDADEASVASSVLAPLRAPPGARGGQKGARRASGESIEGDPVEAASSISIPVPAQLWSMEGGHWGRAMK